MTEEQFEKIKAAMIEHEHKRESDPEYQKECEEFEKRLEALGWPFAKYNG